MKRVGKGEYFLWLSLNKSYLPQFRYHIRKDLHKEKSSVGISAIQGKGSITAHTERCAAVTMTQFILHVAKAGTPTETMVSYLLSWQVYSCYDRLAASVAEKSHPPFFYHPTSSPLSSSTAKWLLSLNSDSFFGEAEGGFMLSIFVSGWHCDTNRNKVVEAQSG